jgi:hypothetical protein
VAKPTDDSGDNRAYLVVLDYFAVPWHHQSIRYWKGDIVDNQALVEYLLLSDWPVKQITRRNFVVCDYLQQGGTTCGTKTYFQEDSSPAAEVIVAVPVNSEVHSNTLAIELAKA